MKSNIKIQVLEALFTEALGKSKSERSNWIKTLNQPESLKSELDELLKVSDSDLDFFTRLKTDINEKLESEFQDFEIDNGFKIGPYSIINRIAKGGMSNVYLAKRVEGDFEQTVAIKIINGFLASKSGKDQFKFERNILSELQHPNIAQIFDGGVIKGELPYFVMELINGADFLTYHKNRGESEVLNNFLQLLKGLEYAHKRGVIHHDLKPQNVLIDQSGFVKILDFGIAIKIESAAEIKNLQSLFLSPEYASPEQKSGAPISVACDIYQAGLILKKTLFESGFAIAPELNAIIEKSLKVEPEERFASINDFSNAITNFIHGYPVKEYSLSDFYKVKKWSSRNSVLSIFIALLISSIVIGIVSFANQFKLKSEALVLAQKEKQKSDEIKNYLFELIESANPEVNLGDTLTIYELLEKGKNKIIGDSLNSGLSLEVALEMSRMYKKMGDYRNADSITRYVLKELDTIKGPNDILLNNEALFELADLYSSTGRYNETDSLIEIVLKQRAFSPKRVNDSIWISSLFERASLYSYFFRKHVEADSLLHVIINETERREIVSINFLGSIYYTMGLNNEYQSIYDSAIHYYYKSLLTYKSAKDYKRTNVINVQLQLASVYSIKGPLDSATAVSDQVIALSEKYYGETHPYMQRIYGYMGLVNRRTGKNQEAIKLYKKALKVGRIENPEGTVAMNYNYNNIGRAYYSMELYDSALVYYDSALASTIAFYGDRNKEAADVIFNIGKLMKKQENYKEALKMLKRAGSIYDQTLPSTHFYRRNILQHIAQSKYEINPKSDWENDIKKAISLKREQTGNKIDAEILNYDIAFMRMLAKEKRKIEAFEYYQSSKGYLTQNLEFIPGNEDKLLLYVTEVMENLEEPDSLKAFALLVEAYKERNSN